MCNRDQQQNVILNTFLSDSQTTLTTVNALSALTTKALMSYEDGDEMDYLIEVNDLLRQSIILLSIQLEEDRAERQAKAKK